MKSIFIFILSLCVATGINCQSFAWAKHLGGDGKDRAFSIAVDALGNVYTTGIFEGQADFDPGPATYLMTSNGDDDVFVCKLAANGNFLWAFQLGGPGYEDARNLVLDDQGNVYVTGSFTNTVDFDPGPGTLNFTTTGGYNGFICKYDPSGNLVFALQIGGESAYVTSWTLAIDHDGNILSTGSFWDTADFDPGPGTYTLSSLGMADCYISKYSPSGQFLWAGSMGGQENDAAHAIACDPAGNVYSIGGFGETADLDPGPGTYLLESVAYIDCYIIKLTPGGSLCWARQIGGDHGDYGLNMLVNEDYRLFLTGQFDGTADFDPGPDTLLLSGNGIDQDIFILALDSAGNFAWVRQIGGTGRDVGWGIAQDPAGYLYVTGGFSSVCDFDPGPGTAYLTSVGWYSDAFILKTDSLGNFIWVQQINGGLDDMGYDIMVDEAYSVYSTGYFNDVTDFDPGPGNFYLTSAGNDDAYIHLLIQMSLAAGDLPAAGFPVIFPNPANDYTLIQAPASWEGSKFFLSDQLGRVIRADRLHSGSTLLDLEHFSPGVYLLHIPSHRAFVTKILKK